MRSRRGCSAALTSAASGNRIGDGLARHLERAVLVQLHRRPRSARRGRGDSAVSSSDARIRGAAPQHGHAERVQHRRAELRGTKDQRVSSSPGTESNPVWRMPEFVPLAPSPALLSLEQHRHEAPAARSASAAAAPTTPAPTTADSASIHAGYVPVLDTAGRIGEDAGTCVALMGDRQCAHGAAPPSTIDRLTSRGGWRPVSQKGSGRELVKMHPMRGLTRVSIGLETAPEEVEAVERVFSAANVHAIVDPEIARFSVDSPWVMYLTAPLEPFASLFSGQEDLSDEAAWTGIKRFVEEISDAYGNRAGSMVFTDEESEVIVAFTSALPDDAYADLLCLDLTMIEGKRISWDPEVGAWHTLGGDICPKK